MSGGSVRGVCAETAREIYVNSSEATAFVDIWVKNSGECNIGVEVAPLDGGFHEPLAGSARWELGNDFLQHIQVPPKTRVWLVCRDIHSGEPEPSTGFQCSYEWEIN
jgi:hypothetical protein